MYLFAREKLSQFNMLQAKKVGDLRDTLGIESLHDIAPVNEVSTFGKRSCHVTQINRNVLQNFEIELGVFDLLQYELLGIRSAQICHSGPF